MNRIAFGFALVVLAVGVGCKKPDPSSPKYWERLLEDRKKARAAMTRIGDELKDPKQRKWGAELVLKYFDLAAEPATVALGKLRYPDPGAIAKLTAALKSNDPGLMARAANSLRQLKVTKAIPELINILKSWKPKNPRKITEVRKQVTKALRDLRARDAVPVLIEMADSREHGLIVNLLAIQALGNIADPRGIPALVRALFLACPADRCSAAARIALNRFGKRAIPELLKAATRKNEFIEKLARRKKLKDGRVTAVPLMVIGDLGNAQTADRLVSEFLKGPASFTKVNAISAIGHTGAKEHLEKLIKTYKKEPLEARTNILHATHRIGDKSAIPFLRKVIKKNADPNLLWTAGLALSYLGGAEELPVVQKVLKKAQKDVKTMKGQDRAITRQTIHYFKAFVARLKAAKGCNSSACWRKKLRSPNKQVRGKAARMLGYAKDERSRNEAALIKALSDPSKEVRVDIYHALSRIGTGKAVKALERRCKEDKGKSGMREPLFYYRLLAERLKARAGV